MHKYIIDFAIKIKSGPCQIYFVKATLWHYSKHWIYSVWVLLRVSFWITSIGCFNCDILLSFWQNFVLAANINITYDIWLILLIYFLFLYCSWYFRKIKRIEAEKKLLLPENEHGAFLIRDSESRHNDYSLSGKIYYLFFFFNN